MSRISRAIACAFALLALTVTTVAQTPAIEPCPAPTPAKKSSPSREKIFSGSTLSNVDASIPADEEVEKMLAPYSERVRELSRVIGRLENELSKSGVGAGSLGNFVTDGMRAQAQTRIGKPVALVIMNSGGLRKNEIAAGEVRASDIFELLPFENALIALEVSGAQLENLMRVVTRDAQAGARIHFKWNDQNRAEFVSAKLLDEHGQEQEIDPAQTYTVVTIDYLLRLGTGPYAILQEAKSGTPLNVTLRDAIMDHVKAETAAGRAIRSAVDDRFVQVGPGPTTGNPND